MAESYLHLVSLERFNTATYALYLYDHLLTLSDEVSAIWSRPFTFGSLLFFTNRYLTYITGVADQVGYFARIPPSICHQYIKFYGSIPTVSICVVELILILRVYCLYARNKIVFIVLFVLWLAQVTLSAWIVASSVKPEVSEGFAHSGGCALTADKPYTILIWGLPALLDLCIFILTLLRVFDRFLHRRRNEGSRSLLDVMIRDGTMYFSIIFSLLLLNILVYLFAPRDLKVTLANFTDVMASLLVARMQLNLRVPEDDTITNPLSMMRFARGNVFKSFLSVGNLGDDVVATGNCAEYELSEKGDDRRIESEESRA